MHDEFAAAAEREPVHCRDRRDRRVLERLRSLLELLDERFDFGKPTRHQLIRDADLARGFECERFGLTLHALRQLSERGGLAAFRAGALGLAEIRTDRERRLGL